ncbi:MAG TPA: TetR/AcrR family transcriptional regulator [Solirubrobacterales bacterium]
MKRSDSANRRATRTRRTREEARAHIIDCTTELVRTRSYAQLSIGEIMDAAGIGRTLFYRYFDDLPDLLARASGEAIEELYAAELELEKTYRDDPAQAIEFAIEAAVAVYSRHGPLLRALSEAATVDLRIATAQRASYARFDALVARVLSGFSKTAAEPLADVEETARALNLMNTSYLLAAFGDKPRVTREVAVQTLTEIWLGVVNR